MTCPYCGKQIVSVQRFHSREVLSPYNLPWVEGTWSFMSEDGTVTQQHGLGSYVMDGDCPTCGNIYSMGGSMIFPATLKGGPWDGSEIGISWRKFIHKVEYINDLPSAHRYHQESSGSKVFVYTGYDKCHTDIIRSRSR